MLGSQVVILITIAVYLIAMVLIGVYFGKKGSGNSSDDFYLGGRKMGPLVTAMSAEASDIRPALGPSPCRTFSPAGMAIRKTCFPPLRRW